MESLSPEKISDTKAQIEQDINSNSVVLYMKGSKTEPMCGFSAQVVNALNDTGVEYVTKNVLEDEYLRQAIKDFSDWPTIPQLYIKGEFIGGCDIVLELYQSGDLQKQLST
jgi:monothiol glutaredoxin